MLVEIDQFLVDKDLWKRAVEGEEFARYQIACEIENNILYMHNIIPYANDIVVTLRDLEGLHILESITLHAVAKYKEAS